MELNNDEADVVSFTDIVGKSNTMVYFDEVIGHIESIILSDEFQTLHNSFLEANWKSIEPTDENKHEYMEIFQEYTRTFETFLMEELTHRMSTFNMQYFAELLSQNDCFRDTANYGEIFELLHSFSDFQVFKELMLDYRYSKEGKLQHLNFDILVTKPLKQDQLSNGNEIDITNALESGKD